jgi:outer membrane protein OmpA-like peptidoglycan-associated protein
VPNEVSAPAAQANARFGLENTDGNVTITGQVANDADKLKLWDALKAAFGDANLSGDITVDPNTLPAGWMDKLIAILPELKAKGLKFGFDGDKLQIDTSSLPEDQRFALSESLRRSFGGFEMSGLWDRASAALTGLKSGFSGDDLIHALNLMTVYFDTGSDNISRDSLETLRHAAKAIAAAPAGTRIEAGGHTDNTGDAAANLNLSQQRAEAVVAKLGELGVASGTLVSKGYGQEQPIADNSTAEGQAKNRRIQFTVLK